MPVVEVTFKQPSTSPGKSPLVKRPTTAQGNFLKTIRSKEDLDLNPNGNTTQQDEMTVTEIDNSYEDIKDKVEWTEVRGESAGVNEVNEDISDSTQTNEQTERASSATDEIFVDDLPPISPKQERYLMQKFATLWLNKIKSDDDKLVDRNCRCCATAGLAVYHKWIKLQNVVYKVVNDGLFELFITLCIATNTVIMATEYYNECELCRLCVGINATCTVCPSGTCNFEVDSQSEWKEGMPKVHAEAMDIANIVFTVIFTVEAIIKLTALSKEYFSVGWNIFDLIIVALSLPDLALYFLQVDSLPGLAEVTRIIKIFRLLRIVKLAQSWSAMRNLLSIVFGAFGALVNLSLILIIIMFIFAVLGNQLLGQSYTKCLDPQTYPELADFDGRFPRWHFYDFTHSFLMVFRILCGEWVEPLWDCMRVNSVAGCTALFLATLILGNFMIFNLFLALLLNSFSSESLKEKKSVDSESKLKRSLLRFYHCFKEGSKHCQPSPAKEKAHENGRVTRLEAILNGKRPSIALNGSHLSVKSSSKNLNGSITKNGSLLKDEVKSVTDASSHMSNGIELIPIPQINGNAKSRSGSVVSEISMGVNHTNGILKNKNPDLSPNNVKNIEKAFSAQRDQYAQLEMAVFATNGGCSNSPRTQVIITTEDFSTKGKPESPLIQDEASDGDSNDENDEDASNESPVEVKDDEDAILDHGHIVLPDCCCPICHRNTKLHNCCSKSWDNFRLVCGRVVTHKAFEGTVLVLIGASSITLCFEDIHLHEDPQLKQALTYLNIIFAFLFVLEMTFKLFALGARKYFTGFWSILDFIIVGISIVDIIGTYMTDIDISAFRVLRTLRALRPLRAVSRWQSMTIIVNALIFAMPAIANVLLVGLVFWLIFVIMGVQEFRGRFFYCEINGLRVESYPNDHDCNSLPIPENLTTYKFPPTLTSCNASIISPLLGDDTKQWHWAKLCMLMGGTWKKPFINFDDVGAGYLALYQTATFEGWMEVMDSAIDHNPTLGGQPDFELSLYWYFYFVIFIIFGAFFTLNLFIGVIIDNFNVLKKKYDGSYLTMFLTDGQRHYYNTLKRLGNRKPQKTIIRPKGKIQGAFFDLATNKQFEIGVTVVIFLNMIVMMIDQYPPQLTGSMNDYGEFVPNTTPSIDYNLLTQTLNYLNIAFTVVFVIEAVIKIIGLRLHYFRRAWNVFDFVVVILSVFGIVLDQIISGDAFISPTLLRVIRVFRIGRVLRLVKAAKGIRKLLFALVISIPVLFNVATLLFLFMFIFAIIGMTFFLNVRHKDDLNEFVNFETFPNSILLLFRLCTSGGWNDVIDPLLDEGNCNSTHYIDTLGVPQKSGGGDCSSRPTAIIFFIGYLFLTFMIIINMYIAVILENFSQAHEQEEIGITEDDFDEFYVVWERYDPHATQYIKLEHLSDLIDKLEPPLGVPKPNGMAIVAFNLPIIEGDRVHCLDILRALVKKALHSNEMDMSYISAEHKDAREKLEVQIAEKYKAAFPHRHQIKILSTTMQRKKEDVAAKTLQRAWRNHRVRTNIRMIQNLAGNVAQHERLARRFSNALSSIASRISSALGRRGSTKSSKSNQLHADIHTNNRKEEEP